MSRKTNDPVRDATAADSAQWPTADSVADYLTRHPDFFAERPELLARMAVPSRWSGDGVVDMQRYLLERTRSEMADLRDCAQEVIETSRSNMSVQTRTHAAALALIAVPDLDHLLQVVSDDLPLLLDLEVVSLGFEETSPPLAPLVSAEVRRLPKGKVDKLLGADKNVRLMKTIKDDGTLFGSAAGLVRSAALARLRPGKRVPAGLLAFGSRGATFRPNQGTELIHFLTRVLESCLHRLAER
jgi:uncharacterized protein YigA (DUF484 family)